MEIKLPSLPKYYINSSKTNWTPDELTIRHLHTCLNLKNRWISELEEKIKQLEEKIK
jgi:hypothetical protein